jgi:hypothetical protein
MVSFGIPDKIFKYGKYKGKKRCGCHTKQGPWQNMKVGIVTTDFSRSDTCAVIEP